MKQLKHSIFLLAAFMLFTNCSEQNNEPQLPLLENIQILKSSYEPLQSKPLEWSDNELRFLDDIAQNDIVGLGEATHGTKEFFQAKHRILQYLVENHGYKVFSIEADFGESIYLNRLVLEGNSVAIESEMKDKMHFWTWKTTEVRDLIMWMADYNKGKPMSERLHYIGNDCQFNTYNPVLVKDYLLNTLPNEFYNALDVLDEAVLAQETRYENHQDNQLRVMVEGIDSLLILFQQYEEDLINNSSALDYELYLQTLKVSKQVLDRRLHSLPTINRDYFMAENTAWVKEYLPNAKVVLWAHNAHVADNPTYQQGAQGYFLRNTFNVNYETIAFSFTTGSFNAVLIEDNDFKSLQKHTISDNPVSGSLNEAFHNTGESAFFIDLEVLMQDNDWSSTFQNGVQHLEIGAGFGKPTSNFYRLIKLPNYDNIIYLDDTNASEFLR